MRIPVSFTNQAKASVPLTSSVNPPRCSTEASAAAAPLSPETETMFHTRPQLFSACGLLLALAFICTGASGTESATTFGTTNAQMCYEASKLQVADVEGLTACNNAIAGSQLNVHDLAATYSNRGIIYSQLGQFHRALSDHNKAIQLEPTLGEAYINRGNVYYRTHYYEKALDDYNKAIQLGAAPAVTVLYNKALTLIELKRYDGAKAALEQALKLAPQSPRIQEKLDELSK